MEHSPKLVLARWVLSRNSSNLQQRLVAPKIPSRSAVGGSNARRSMLATNLDSIAMNRPLTTRTQRAVSIVFFSVNTGTLMGVLTWFVALPADPYLPPPVVLALSAVFGAVIGIVSSPFVVGFLWHRDLTHARPIVLWSTSAFVAILSLIAGGSQMPQAIAIAGCGLIITSLLARWALPRVWEMPGLCRFCGYDIRASVEFNRCPECGRPLTCETWLNQHSSPAGFRSRAVQVLAFMVRRPWVPVLLVIATLVIRAILRGIPQVAGV